MVIKYTGINPETGNPYTTAELEAFNLENIPTGGYPAVATTKTAEAPSAGYPAVSNIKTTTPTGGNINPYTGQPFTTADLSGMGVATAKDFWNFYNQGLIQDGQYVGEPGVVGTGGWGENVPTPYNIPGAITPTTEPCDADGVPCSISGKPPVTPLAVTPAPAYEISPEQKAWDELYGGKLTDWVEAEGYGIPEETQKLMIQQQTDTLKANEAENLRVMRNNMERRGITNSGFVFAAEQTIHSNTTKALAGAIADIQIKSALMKMASFEIAMGQAGQFLGYLSEQSQLKYAPEFATWQAEQMAKMAAWQETMDRQKMAINQCYQAQNIRLQAQLQSQLAEQLHLDDIELAQMELDAAQESAKAEAKGSISGTIVTGLFTVAAAVLG